MSNWKWWNKGSWNNGTIRIFKQFSENSWMLLITCETNILLTWSANCVIVSTDKASKSLKIL